MQFKEEEEKKKKKKKREENEGIRENLCRYLGSVQPDFPCWELSPPLPRFSLSYNLKLVFLNLKILIKRK